VLADLTVEAPVLAAITTVLELDQLLATESALQWVIVDRPEGPGLISRSWFENAMAGRLGYGRLVLRRRPLAEIVPGGSLVFPHDCTVARAAGAIIPRRSEDDRIDAVIVTAADGSMSIAPVTAVFEQSPSSTPTSRCTTRSPACRTAPSSSSGCARPAGPARRRCSATSTSTGSRTSTTTSATRPATRC
jgi:hypothetical protein